MEEQAGSHTSTVRPWVRPQLDPTEEEEASPVVPAAGQEGPHLGQSEQSRMQVEPAALRRTAMQAPAEVEQEAPMVQVSRVETTPLP